MKSKKASGSVGGVPTVKMLRRDYFRLPEDLRQTQNGLKVLASLGAGRQGFLPVQLVG
ncbi:hypothetical protein [Chromobacterium amazonense]|uniref:hypothetical protein n=1 Tax=Chromobacterium amazonense TaxID=1382803 RepID=UPI0016712947|nr:hypothetical protein [Chromobacterium amazonense]